MLKDLLRYKVNAVRLGLILLGAFLVFLAMAFAINRTFSLTFWDKGYELKADFVDADGIANAADVRIAGVYIGQVSEIRGAAGGLAEITFRVDKEHSPLRQGTRANLRLQTLLGAKFIELTPGPPSNPPLAQESVIPSDSTQSPVDFDQVLSSFDKPTREGLSSLIQELGTATDQRGADINALLKDLHDLSIDSTPDLETFSDRKQHLDAILKNLDDVAQNLGAEREHLAGTYTHLNSVLQTISDNDPAFRRFLHEGNLSLGHGLAQFAGEHQNVSETVRLLRADLDQLNPELVDVNKLTTDFNSFIQIAKSLTIDLFSSVSGYNHNPANHSCDSDGATSGCGGFYLRQPAMLAGSQLPTDTENGAGSAAGAAGAGAARSPAQPGASLLPRLPLPIPLLPDVPSLPGIPGLTGPLTPPPLGSEQLSINEQDAAERALFDYLLGA